MALLFASGSVAAQGNYPGNAVLINGETISNQRFHGFYIEYRNSKGVAVGARGWQHQLLGEPVEPVDSEHHGHALRERLVHNALHVHGKVHHAVARTDEAVLECPGRDDLILEVRAAGNIHEVKEVRHFQSSGEPVMCTCP